MRGFRIQKDAAEKVVPMSILKTSLGVSPPKGLSRRPSPKRFEVTSVGSGAERFRLCVRVFRGMLKDGLVTNSGFFLQN